MQARLITEAELAQQLQLSINFLRKDRRTLRRLPYLKIGGAVRYDPDQVQLALRALAVGGCFAEGGAK